MLSDPKAKSIFQDFAKEKLTNIKEADAYSEALNKTYKRLFHQNKKELNKAQKKLDKARKSDRKQYERAMKQYKKVLWKREVHLMKRHGFTLKNGGWYMPQKKGKIIGVYGKVEATVTNTEKFDLLAVYAVYPDRKGLNAFVTEQPGIYHSSLIADPNNEDAIPVMFKERTLLMAVGYVDEQAYFIKKSIKANPTLQYRLKLEPVSRSFVQNAINEYDKFPSHSKISKDLDYQWKMVKERKRLKRIEDEWRMMSKLHSLATQGCVNCDEEEAIELSGEVLFNSNCAACHKPKGQLVGPELQGIWDKYASRGETAFLFDFVRNSSKLITEGDPHAVALYDDYGKQQMTAFPTLCDAEIKAILAYTDAWVVE